MAIYEVESERITPIPEARFAKLGLKERSDLQRRVRVEPYSLEGRVLVDFQQILQGISPRPGNAARASGGFPLRIEWMHARGHADWPARLVTIGHSKTRHPSS